jgi:DNA-binding response OmpR family regulator
VSESRRILLVEDCPDSREMYAIGLTMAGFVVLEAGTVSEALAAIEAGNIDVIVCDLRLADGSGIDVVRRLRERGSGVAYALTGVNDDRLRQEAFGAGCAEVLVKPVAPDELLARIGYCAPGTAGETPAVPGADAHDRPPHSRFR